MSDVGWGTKLKRRALVPWVVAACFSPNLLAGTDIKGVAQNVTRGESAAGDEVALLRIDQGMREQARSKADPLGRFIFHVQNPDKLYVLRVTHQGVNYDQQVSPGGVVSVHVFDAARTVPGITGTIEIIRTGTNGSLLHVSDMYEIENESRPPLTQAGERTFEAYLPQDARIDSVLAAGPGKTVEMLSATPVPDEPGHYTVNFPLQPGSTKFAFNYDLPYDGHAAFRTRRAYPVQQFAVMIAPTMKFSSHSALFQVLPAANPSYQVYAANELRAGEGPGFEIAGTGPPPLIGEQPKSPDGSQPADTSSPQALARPAVPLSLPRIGSPLQQAPTVSQSAVLTGVAAVLFVVCILLVWRARRS
jgi:hypothetical protein